MVVLAWVTGIILTLGFLMTGSMKLTGNATILEVAERLGFENLRQAIGGAEILAAIGVFIGLLTDGNNLEWVGFLAAIGVILLMIGAVIYHVRAGDEPNDWAPAAVMGVLAVLYIIGIGAR